MMESDIDRGYERLLKAIVSPEPYRRPFDAELEAVNSVCLCCGNDKSVSAKTCIFCFNEYKALGIKSDRYKFLSR
jgi:hypothetical protein